MSTWLEQAGTLLNQGRTATAADLAASRICGSGAGSSDEVLMAYVIADHLLDETLMAIHHHKDMVTPADEQNIDTALALARAALPHDHPLLILLLRRASQYRFGLQGEVAALWSGHGRSAA